MPTKMMPSCGKPPLARSPIRLRPRRALHSSVTAIQTTPARSQPPGSVMKTKLSKSVCVVGSCEKTDSLRPEYQTISCELRALAKMVNQEFGSSDMVIDDSCDLGNILSANNRSPLFERGRFYEEYSARRNERLKRKKTGDDDEKKKKKATVYDLGVRVDSAKRRGETKSNKKTMLPCTPLTERKEAPPSSRYSLRSAASKENKIPMGIEQSVSGIGTNKITVRRGRKN